MWQFMRRRPILGSLLGAFVLSLTVVTVVAIGILVAFGAVILILQAFAREEASTSSETPLVVASRARAAHAGGD
jgi:hypothetical protein